MLQEDSEVYLLETFHHIILGGFNDFFSSRLKYFDVSVGSSVSYILRAKGHMYSPSNPVFM